MTSVHRVFCNSVQSGTLRIKTGHYPCFLYPDNAAYNSKNIAKGLFHGHIFIRVRLFCYLCVHRLILVHPKALRSIYTGPSSAFTGHWTAARSSNAELHGMKEVTPEMIAYISVQVSSSRCLIVLHILMTIISRLILHCPTWGTGPTSAIAHSTTKNSSTTLSSCFTIEILPGCKRPSNMWLGKCHPSFHPLLMTCCSQLLALNCHHRNQKHTTNLDMDQDSEDNTEAILAQ